MHILLIALISAIKLQND